MVDRSLLNLLKGIVLKQLMFLRIYTAKVIDISDPNRQGMIKVVIPDLCFADADGPQASNTQFTGWADCVSPMALLTPKVGDWVEVYFPGGDRHRLKWFGMSNDVQAVRPAAYAQNTQVLFQDRNTTAAKVLYDGQGNVLKMFAASEQFVKGTTFKPEQDKFWTIMQNILASIPNMVYTGTPGDTATWQALWAPIQGLPRPDFSQILSDRIKGE